MFHIKCQNSGRIVCRCEKEQYEGPSPSLLMALDELKDSHEKMGSSKHDFPFDLGLNVPVWYNSSNNLEEPLYDAMSLSRFNMFLR